MAKKKVAPPSAGDIRAVVISMKGTAEFRAWLDRLADSQRDSSVQTIEKALVLYAKHVGFEEPAPRRTAK